MKYKELDDLILSFIIDPFYHHCFVSVPYNNLLIMKKKILKVKQLKFPNSSNLSKIKKCSLKKRLAKSMSGVTLYD